MNFRGKEIEESVLLIDFDNTLFGSNSTELFISRCRPGCVASIIDFVIRECVPWRKLGFGNQSRTKDYTCVIALILLTPWNLILWRIDAPALWKEYAQSEFNVFLKHLDHKNIIVISFGMRILISALIRDTKWRRVQLIATPLMTNRKFLCSGKLSMLRESDKSDLLQKAAFITDSEDDSDLLNAVSTGFLIQATGSKFRSLERLYLPFRYTLRAKYPFLYFIDQLLFVDILILLIATTNKLSTAFTNSITIIPLFLAFMMIYEVGYYENDFIGAAREKMPSLTPDVMRFGRYPIELNAWVWALVFTVTGALIDSQVGPVSSPIEVSIVWLMVLSILRIVFYLYNRLNVERRILIYPVLQFLKYAPITLLFRPDEIVGRSMIVGQIATMSIVYLLYRNSGKKPKLNREFLRVFCMLVVAGVLVIRPDATVAVNGFTASLALGWLLLRIAKPFLVR